MIKLEEKGGYEKGKNTTKLGCIDVCNNFNNCILELTCCDKNHFFLFFLRNSNIEKNSEKKEKSKKKEKAYKKAINNYVKENFSNKDEFYSEFIQFIELSFLDLDNQGNIPDNIKNLLKDEDFRKVVLIKIGEKLSNILEDAGINSFEEINFLLFLLGMDKAYDISQDIFTSKDISFVEVEKLLGYYNDLICKLEVENKDEFIRLIATIQIFFDLLNKIILFGFKFFPENKNIAKLLDMTKNQMVFIKTFIEAILEKVNGEKNISNIMGIYELMFSYNLYKVKFLHNDFHQSLGGDEKKIFDSKNSKEIDIDLLGMYTTIFNSQVGGYTKIKSSDYGDGKTPEKQVNIAFIGNVSTSLLEMISSISDENFLNEENLENIFSKYKEYINPNFNFTDLENFKKELYSNIYKIYSDATDTDKKYDNLGEIIDDFIEKNNFADHEIEAIGDLLKFSDYTDFSKLIKLGEYFLNKDKFASDYYEKFKLDIIFLILEKIIDNGEFNETSLSFVEKLALHIGKNKIASNLLYLYTEFYLYLALYYSNLPDLFNQTKAKNFFYQFKQIYKNSNSNNFSKFDKFSEIYNKLEYNIGKNYNNSKSLDEDEIQVNSELDISKSMKEEYKKIFTKTIDCENTKKGKEIISNYKGEYYFKLIADITSEVFSLLQQSLISGQNALDEKVFKLISQKLFYGICEIKLLHGKEKSNIKKGYNFEKINLSHETVQKTV